MLSHANLASNALVLKDYWRWRAGDVLIHALPIYHVHGLFVALHGALLNGSTMLWHRGFDADAVIDDLPRATILMGVPTFYTRLLANPRLTREAAAGDAAVRQRLGAAARSRPSPNSRTRTGHRILERYGMTEAGMICSNPYRRRAHPGHASAFRCRASNGVRDAATSRAASRHARDQRARTCSTAIGASRRRPPRSMRPDGFFITGDVGDHGTPDGRVAIVGRAKDLIIAGGLNIYPKEIELALDALPGVAESAVIGVPHPDLGEAVVAVVTRADPALDEATLLAGLADLARFKQPRRILFADAPAAQRDGQGAESGAARGARTCSRALTQPSRSAPDGPPAVDQGAGSAAPRSSRARAARSGARRCAIDDVDPELLPVDPALADDGRALVRARRDLLAAIASVALREPPIGRCSRPAPDRGRVHVRSPADNRCRSQAPAMRREQSDRGDPACESHALQDSSRSPDST